MLGKLNNMAVSMDWLTPNKRIALIEQSEEWLWQEFYTAYDRCIRMAYEVKEPITVIIDASNTPGLPPGAQGQLLGMTKFQPVNISCIALVRDDPLTAAIAKLLQRYRGSDKRRYIHAATLEEAINSLI